MSPADIESPTAREAVTAIWLEADRDWDALEQRLRDAVQREPELAAVIAMAYARTVIRDVAKMRRRNLCVRKVLPIQNHNKDGLYAATKQWRSWLDDYELKGGIRLGDATAIDIDAQVAEHEVQASSNAKRARWLSDIGRKLGSKTAKVRDRLSEKDIQDLWDAA